MSAREFVTVGLVVMHCDGGRLGSSMCRTGAFVIKSGCSSQRLMSVYSTSIQWYWSRKKSGKEEMPPINQVVMRKSVPWGRMPLCPDYCSQCSQQQLSPVDTTSDFTGNRREHAFEMDSRLAPILDGHYETAREKYIKATKNNFQNAP